MSTSTPTALEELRSRRSDLQTEIEGLISERDQLYTDFQLRLSEDTSPSGDEVTRFEARRNHDDPAIRPTEREIEEFEARSSSGPSDEEVQRFNAEHVERRRAITEKMNQLNDFTERIEEQSALDHSLEVAQRSNKGLDVTHIESQRDPLTYRADNQNRHSYFLDLAAMTNPDVRARDFRMEGFEERLTKHAKEMGDLLPERWSRRKAQAEARVEEAENEFRGRVGLSKGGFEVSPFERRDPNLMQREAELAELEQRAPSRIVGQGGYAIPPLWLIDEYIPALRPGRVAAGLCRQMPLPAGTDSINIPRLLTPTLTGIQTADAAPVVSRDFSDTFQQANVKTVAGQEDVPIQLIEQSPGQILDRVLMTDLIADYNKQVDLQVIAGSGVGAPLSGGQVVGMYPASNWGSTSVTWTASSPFGQGFYQVLGAMASKTAYSRFNLVDFTFLMHPRRWFWFATAVDSATAGTGRPLIESAGFGPFNVAALEEANVPYEGLAAQLPFGPRVYIDANVPITDSSGTPGGGSADVAFGAIWDDLWLFEGDLRTRVLSEVLSGTLELRFQIYNYIAFLVRYGVSIAQGTGTGFAAPVTIDSTAY